MKTLLLLFSFVGICFSTTFSPSYIPVQTANGPLNGSPATYATNGYFGPYVNIEGSGRGICIADIDTTTVTGPVTSAKLTVTTTGDFGEKPGFTLAADYIANGANATAQTAANYAKYWFATEPTATAFSSYSFFNLAPTGYKQVYTLTALNNFVQGGHTFLRVWIGNAGVTAQLSPVSISIEITYTPNTAPVTISSSGLLAEFNIGTEQTITATVRAADGYANINYFHVLLDYGVDGVYSCYFLVYPNSNYFHLMNDAGDSWGSGYTFGVAGTAANSSCKVNAATSSRSVSGTDATVTLKITFLPGVFSRPSRPIAAVNSYLWVMDAAAAGQVWGGPYQQATARSGPKLIVTSQR